MNLRTRTIIYSDILYPSTMSNVYNKSWILSFIFFLYYMSAIIPICSVVYWNWDIIQFQCLIINWYIHRKLFIVAIQYQIQYWNICQCLYYFTCKRLCIDLYADQGIILPVPLMHRLCLIRSLLNPMSCIPWFVYP